ncbi:MAG: hypothetical protein ACFE95_02960 [Candidatus Hodarchaeota archaeon]
MKKGKLIAICLIISISALTINVISFDTTELEKSVAESDHEQTKPEIQWNQTYDYKDCYINEALISQTKDGGFVLACSPSSYSVSADIWLVKTDENGVVEWNHTYGGSGGDLVCVLIQTMDGGFALASMGMWLVKTDDKGVMQWNRSYAAGTGPDVAYALIQTTDGGFALAGYTRPRDARFDDMWLIKTDANGVAEWNQTYGGTGSFETTHDGAKALIQTTDGGFILAGYANTGNDMWLVKTDTKGKAQWNETYGRGVAKALIQTVDGDIVIAGTTGSNTISSYDMWLVKTDMNGVIQWNQTYGGTGTEDAYSFIQTADGGFALIGSTKSYGAGRSDMWLVKTDVNGVAEWNQTYGGTEDDWGTDLLQTTDGDFVLAGLTNSFADDGVDVWLIKTGSTSETTTGLEILPLLAAVIVLLSCYKRKNKKS